MKPMSVEQCVSEGLNGLLENRSRIVPGRLNRIMNAQLVPRFSSCAKDGEADMLGTARCRQVRCCKCSRRGLAGESDLLKPLRTMQEPISLLMDMRAMT